MRPVHSIHYILLTLTALVLVFFSISCTLGAKRPTWVSEWLNDPVCGIPCWENITPGETTREQVEFLLSQNQKVRALESVEIVPYGFCFLLNLEDEEYVGDVTIIFDGHDLVQEIQIGYLEGLDLNDMISIHGNPQQVLFLEDYYGYITVELLYPERGMVLELFLLNDSQDINAPAADIRRSSEVLHIYLNNPGLTFFFDSYEIQEPLWLYPWDGYKIYP